jgi:hypothetical protein
MDKKICLQKEAGAKKLFATTTTPKKIVCIDEMSIPPLQKNNGPSLNHMYFVLISSRYDVTPAQKGILAPVLLCWRSNAQNRQNRQL